MEALYLAGTLSTGAYILLSVAGTISRAVSLEALQTQLLPVTSYLKIYAAVLLIPVFRVLKAQWHYHRGTRIHGCQLLPAYPHKDPILGLDLLAKMLNALKEYRVLEQWEENLAKYGRTHWENATGSWYILTSDKENVKAILATQFDNFPILSMRQKILGMILGPRNIFSTNGPEWHAGRAMIRPSFVRNQIADLECTDRHVDLFLKKLPQDGSHFDIDKLLYAFTMDVSTDFMFGYSTNLLTTPDKEAIEFMEAFDTAGYIATTRARLGRLTAIVPNQKLDDAVKTCNHFIQQHVSKAMANGGSKERPYVFLDQIVKSGASHEVICNQIFAMILGGRDTSASTMSSLLHTLARRPDVVAKIRTELAPLDGHKPTWEELKGLKYLNNVFKETLRLYSPVSTNMRTCNHDTVLPKGGGPDGQAPIFVPKGTDVRFSNHSLHRCKEWYGEDAEEFRPERWETLRPSWEYIPFSGGPRICIGQQFALTQMTYLFTRLFQTFDKVETTSTEPMKHRLTTTMSLVGGCWISLKK
ncbi:Cytochrome P450 52E1 [Escovopsis weberi]|uniref:Cytochrome P450 52E1 n=1 Tax=Escovopsis weberi TaxID=150374 RepID=A0A0M9VVC7_ESCWE|nr:Cytochrome P450 52E1 [Escovopsis weberi]